MTDTPKSHGPLDDLTPEQKARLKKISSEMSYDKLTVSFSIEDRDASGRKKSAFYSVTASRGTGAKVSTMGEDKAPAGYSNENVDIARALLCKHVIRSTYDDAIRRRIVSGVDATEECRAILISYDKLIVAKLAKTGTGESK